MILGDKMVDKSGDKLVSGAELSRQTGIPKQTISKKIKSGALVPDSYSSSNRPLFYLEKTRGLLDQQKSFDKAQSHHDGLPKSMQGGRPSQKPNIITNNTEDDSDGEPVSHVNRFNKARADAAVYKAELARIEVEERQNRLVHVDIVSQQGSELGSVLLNALTNLPDRLSDELASLDDSREIHKLLTNEINSMIVNIRKSLSLESE